MAPLIADAWSSRSHTALQIQYEADSGPAQLLISETGVATTPPVLTWSCSNFKWLKPVLRITIFDSCSQPSPLFYMPNHHHPQFQFSLQRFNVGFLSYLLLMAGGWLCFCGSRCGWLLFKLHICFHFLKPDKASQVGPQLALNNRINSTIDPWLYFQEDAQINNSNKI